MMRPIALAGLAALIATSLTAQSSTGTVGPTLSLSEAIRIARENNPTYRQVVNDLPPADWRVRSAYTSLFFPTFDLSGTLGYRGSGRQQFLTTTFEQGSSTISSNYSAALRWRLSGTTLTQPGLEKAQRDATIGDVDEAAQQLETNTTQQYLNVLQVRANAELQRVQVQRNEENLRLAQARYEVGQTTIIDVLRAEVAKGQADVELLRLQHLTRIEMLRLFETMGVEPPEDVLSVDLTEQFEIVTPPWRLDELLALAETANPSLVALRKRETAAKWLVRAAQSAYLPSLSFAAGWSGFTQEFTNVDPLVTSAVSSQQREAADLVNACSFQNEVNTRLTNPLPTIDCSTFSFTPEDSAALSQQIRADNNAFPFEFSSQPFQASLTISLPIFSGFDRARDVSASKAAREDAALSLRRQALQVQTQVAQRFYDVERSYQIIAIQEKNQEAAREQLQLEQERYRVGSGTFFELLEAQVQAQQAERDYINSTYEYHRAVTLLESAVGGKLR